MLQATTLSPKAAATRQRILDTAAALFWKRSYHGVSVDEIAETSGVNKATIYRYFPDKAALALDVTREHGRRIVEGLFGSIFADTSEPDARLYQFYHATVCAHEAQLGEMHDILGCPVTGLVLELGYELPNVRKEAAKVFAAVEDHFREIALDVIDTQAAEGWSAHSLARALMQLLHGAFVSARLAADAGPVRDAGNASLALIGSPLRLEAPSGEHP
ncbi:TetR/AcrR family transcriptional regulator [Parerythrobacter jejuensis]|uniref:TetR family transcriptional regulator n=1 Tax=Parerythrobacter jejuensis TaxID=795812 RepID=A0A845APX1_9SPHN|nr:TetR/AcrR family transcriptional regulator [Parerythrobacter jejuensis]MXP31243.1 TetR family transcriptional regulator [Parerythrobacter jejuensis]MXP34003.1 TetR family transcriptional regulator [Parerythrobacter jejuensis]